MISNIKKSLFVLVSFPRYYCKSRQTYCSSLSFCIIINAHNFISILMQNLMILKNIFISVSIILHTIVMDRFVFLWF